MRVIAGSARGRRLRCLNDQLVRPTKDRVKEAVFSSLGSRLPDSRVLDLFAGSGALGIEALSRGAYAAVFVEIDRKACDLIRSNLHICGWAESPDVRVIQSDAIRWLMDNATGDHMFDVIIADPPYNMGFEEEILTVVSRTGILSRHGIVVMESATGLNLPEDVGGTGLCLSKSKAYGDSTISYYKNTGAL